MFKNLEIYFTTSTSKRLERTLYLCGQLPGFRVFREINRKKNEFIIELDYDQFIQYRQIIEEVIFYISGWSSSYFIIDGDREDRFGFGTLNYLYFISTCADNYPTSSNGADYCRHINIDGWGCNFLDGILYNIYTEAKYAGTWYGFGNFNEFGKWVVDRDRLFSDLMMEAEAKGVTRCPYFSPDSIRKRIEEFPGEIEVDEVQWHFEYGDEIDPTTKNPKKIGITHIDPRLSKDNSNEDRQVSKTNFISKRSPRVSFDDIGGLFDIKRVIQEFIRLPIQHPETIRHFGLKPIKGILFHGPTGNGKTMIAKAISHELGTHFIAINGSELESRWLGESEQNLRIVFQEAAENKPSIIFFDEIDSVGFKRSASDTFIYHNRNLNQLLSLIDGYFENDGVMVIAATNRIDVLDPALIRPGRFDYILDFKQPDILEIEDILRTVTKEMPVQDKDIFRELSVQLLGNNSAEITLFVRRAALNAIKRVHRDGINTQKSDDINDPQNHLGSIVNEDFYHALKMMNDLFN